MNELFTTSNRAYPPLLRHISKPPAELHYRGMLLNPQDIYFAIVGTRHSSPYGVQITEQFASELAEYGFVIVSGLAYGIDAIAHAAALTHHPEKRTIAVLGSGLDHIVPHSNKDLASQIEKTGTLLSEYPDSTTPHKGMFPARNRIIAGMSIATLVIEAPEKSGALITARLALEYNREVFAVPANITQESSRGTNALIKDSKAHPVTSVTDILQILAPHLPASFQSQISGGSQLALPLPRMSPEEHTVYSLIQKSPKSSDEIMRETKMSSAKIASIISMLEIKGLVQISGSYILTTR